MLSKPPPGETLSNTKFMKRSELRVYEHVSACTEREGGGDGTSSTPMNSSMTRLGRTSGRQVVMPDASRCSYESREAGELARQATRISFISSLSSCSRCEETPVMDMNL